MQASTGAGRRRRGDNRGVAAASPGTGAASRRGLPGSTAATVFEVSPSMHSDPARTDRPTRLVLFHGLASTPKEFGFLAHPLRRQGVKLHAPEVPGYSHGRLAPRPCWRDWVDAAADALAALGTEEPFVLGGLCTGSFLGLAVAAERPLPGLRGVAMLSPTFACDGWALPWWYRLRHLAYGLGLAGRFSMAERAPYGLKNERMRQWIRQQLEAQASAPVGSDGVTPIGPARIALPFVRESERLARHGRALLARVQRPLLVQHAREDEICRLATVRRALRAVPPHLLSLQVLDDSYHMITADNDRHLVADQLAAYMHSLAVAAGPLDPGGSPSDAPSRAAASSYLGAPVAIAP
jgi:carboxylesterase